MGDAETTWTGGDTTWTTPPCLGLVPHFHGDPAMGGVPQASADGHWWWDGRHWTPVHVPTLADARAAAQETDQETAQESAQEAARETAQPAPAWARAG